MGLRVSEEYQPQYRQLVNRTNPKQTDPIAQQLTEEARAIEARGERQAERLGEMISNPVEGFFKGRERAQAQRLREQQSQLTEEQMQRARLDRELQEKYGDRTKQAELTTAESQSDINRQAANEAKRRAEIMSSVDESSGKTLQELLARRPLEQDDFNRDTTERQIAIQERQADEQAKANAIAARTQRLNQEVAQINLEELQQTQAVRGMIGNLNAAETDEEKAAIFQGLKEQDPVLAGMALSQMKDKVQANRLKNMMSASLIPSEAAKLEMSKKAMDERMEMNAYFASLDDTLEEVKNAPNFSEEMADRAEALAKQAEEMGRFEDARKIRNFVTIDFGGITGRKEAADKFVNNMKKSALREYKGKYGGMFPNHQRWADSMLGDQMTMAERAKAGMFGPQAQAQEPGIYTPQVPGANLSWANQQSPQQTAQEAQNITTQQSLQQNPRLQFLQQGKPVNQTAQPAQPAPAQQPGGWSNQGASWQKPRFNVQPGG